MTMHVINPEEIKAKSIETIRSWGLPAIDHLPALETEDELSPRGSSDVARRSIVMIHVIVIGFGADRKRVKNAISDFGLMEAASIHERDLLSRDEHTEQEKIDAQWLAECMQSFAWCLGLANLQPLQYCDDDLSSKFPAPFTDPKEFIESARIRPFVEIYRQADIHYRLHWAARNARVTGLEFPVSESLLRERRRALDWVIGVESDWDEMPLDT
jgi:hypothetical protein